MGVSPLLDLYKRSDLSIASLFIGSVPSDLVFSRPQTGEGVTYFGMGGLLKAAKSHEARFDYDPATGKQLGLLYEPQSTNNLLYGSTPYTNWTYNNGVKSLYGASWGLFSDICVVPSGGADWHRLTQSFNAVSGVTYSWVAYVISGTSGKVMIEARIPNVSAIIGGSLNASLVGASAVTSIGTLTLTAYETMNNGVVRLSGTFLPTSTATATFGVGPYSATTGATIIVVGASVEVGTKATSFIVTGASAVTRAADQLSFTVPSGVSALRYVFDDNSVQDVTVSAGAYVVPTTLSRSHIKRILYP